MELTQNHRTDPASRLIADNCNYIATNQAGMIDTKEGVFDIVAGSSYSYNQLALQYADRPRELQVMAYTNERRHIINGVFLKALGFAHPDQFADAPGWAEKHYELKKGVKFVFRKNLAIGSGVAVVNGEVGAWAPLRRSFHYLFYLQVDLVDRIYDQVDSKQQYDVESHRDEKPSNVSRFLVCEESKKTIPIKYETASTMQPAYCTTLHTMQGGSTRHALLDDTSAPGGAFPRLSREALYTACSRATHRFTYVAIHATRPMDALKQFWTAMDYSEPRRETTLPDYLGEDKDATVQLPCGMCRQSFETLAYSDVSKMSRLCSVCMDLASAEV